jgi:hypothetical protein
LLLADLNKIRISVEISSIPTETSVATHTRLKSYICGSNNSDNNKKIMIYKSTEELLMFRQSGNSFTSPEPEGLPHLHVIS